MPHSQLTGGKVLQTAYTIPTVLFSCVSFSTPDIKTSCILTTYFDVCRQQLEDKPRIHPASILACELSTRVLRRGVQRLSLPTNFINNALVHRVIVLQRTEGQVRLVGTQTSNGPSDVHLAFAATKHPLK